MVRSSRQKQQPAVSAVTQATAYHSRLVPQFTPANPSRVKNVLPGTKRQNGILMTFQVPGHCRARHVSAMAPHWHPEFSLRSRLQTPALIQEGPGGQFGRRAKVWIHICLRMVPRFQGLLHVNPWRVHRAASRDSPGLTKALKKSEFRARYLGSAWSTRVQGSFITVDRAPSPPPHSGMYLGIRS